MATYCITQVAGNFPQGHAYYGKRPTIRMNSLGCDTITCRSESMESMMNTLSCVRRRILHVALATALLLMVPLLAMQFTDEVQWSLFDFIVMGVLLLGTGLTYVFVSGLSDSSTYRIAVGIAAVTGFLLVWMNLAVGIIGSEDNPANSLYLGVLAIGLFGALLSRFKPRGMTRTMFAVALAQFLVPIIALIIWRPTMDDLPGIVGVFMLNSFFAALFAVSGLLFARSAPST